MSQIQALKIKKNVVEKETTPKVLSHTFKLRLFICKASEINLHWHSTKKY